MSRHHTTNAERRNVPLNLSDLRPPQDAPTPVDKNSNLASVIRGTIGYLAAFIGSIATCATQRSLCYVPGILTDELTQKNQNKTFFVPIKIGQRFISSTRALFSIFKLFCLIMFFIMSLDIPLFTDSDSDSDSDGVSARKRFIRVRNKKQKKTNGHIVTIRLLLEALFTIREQIIHQKKYCQHLEKIADYTSVKELLMIEEGDRLTREQYIKLTEKWHWLHDMHICANSMISNIIDKMLENPKTTLQNATDPDKIETLCNAYTKMWLDPNGPLQKIFAEVLPAYVDILPDIIVRSTLLTYGQIAPARHSDRKDYRDLHTSDPRIPLPPNLNAPFLGGGIPPPDIAAAILTDADIRQSHLKRIQTERQLRPEPMTLGKIVTAQILFLAKNARKTAKFEICFPLDRKTGVLVEIRDPNEPNSIGKIIANPNSQADLLKHIDYKVLKPYRTDPFERPRAQLSYASRVSGETTKFPALKGPLRTPPRRGTAQALPRTVDPPVVDDGLAQTISDGTAYGLRLEAKRDCKSKDDSKSHVAWADQGNDPAPDRKQDRAIRRDTGPAAVLRDDDGDIDMDIDDGLDDNGDDHDHDDHDDDYHDGLGGEGHDDDPDDPDDGFDDEDYDGEP